MRPLLAALPVLLGLAPLAAQPSDAARAREVVAQVNWARQHPQAAAEALRSWLKAFEGDRYLCFPGEPRLRMEEGRTAVVEAIAFLDRQPPVPPVAWSDRLAVAAGSLAEDQGRLGGWATGPAMAACPRTAWPVPVPRRRPWARWSPTAASASPAIPAGRSWP